jgi:uncharacterized glyoxalase superfamily protein PhnB
MMKTNVHLTFEGGKCTEAFAFYEKVFNTKSEFKMTYGEAPPGALRYRTGRRTW